MYKKINNHGYTSGSAGGDMPVVAKRGEVQSAVEFFVLM